MPEQNRAQKICENMDRIGRKILVMSGKGGVGKTTVTVNLAYALLDMGFTVGILDTDLHGPNIAKMLGCESASLGGVEGCIEPVAPRKDLKVVSLSFVMADPNSAVIFRGPMKVGVIQQFLADVNWGTLDYLLIDSPPGTGDEQLTVVQNIPAMTGGIVVTTPQEVAVLDSRRSIDFARQAGLKVLGVIENMSYLVCPHCGERIQVFGAGGGKALCTEAGVPLIGRVPMEPGLGETEDRGKNWLESGDSVSAKEFRDIAAFINMGTKPSKSSDIGYVPQNESCSPSSCASCGYDCPSKKS